MNQLLTQCSTLTAMITLIVFLNVFNETTNRSENNISREDFSVNNCRKNIKICWIKNFLLKKSNKKIKSNKKSVCLSVWQSIGSAPGHDKDLRPVSLEPVGPQVESRGNNFSQKWPVA